jgi:hypothetical protein
MKTSSITFSKHEVAVMLPALEDLLNGIVEACRRDSYPRRDTTHIPYRGQEVYRERRFNGKMAAHVLSCRNELKFKGASRTLDLNCFELAVAGLAFRVVRKEKLVSKDMLLSPSVAGLECKIENARKRAKRSAIKQIGPASYKEKADRWSHFAEWMRYNLLYYRSRRSSNKNSTLFHKEQRETMRALAMQVVVETADQLQIYHLADLARREIRRHRHVEVSPTLRALLEYREKARQFLASFFLKRLDPEILVPEFQSLDVRQSNCGEKLKRALRFDED